jgi:phosphoenolpyruvate phosphomutase
MESSDPDWSDVALRRANVLLVHLGRYDDAIREYERVKGRFTDAKQAIDLATVNTVDNDDFATTGEAASLTCAGNALVGETVIAYGDILFKPPVLDALMAGAGDIVLVCDVLGRGKDHRAAGRIVDLVACTGPRMEDYLDDAPVVLTRIGDTLPPGEVDAEWIGLARLTAAGAQNPEP